GLPGPGRLGKVDKSCHNNNKGPEGPKPWSTSINIVIDSGNHGVNSLRLTKVLALLGLLLVTALVTASGIQLPAIPNVVVWHCVLEAWALIATMLVFAVAWCSPLAQSSGGVRVLACGF